MRLADIGGVVYAFELDWIGLGDQKADVVAKEYASEGGKWLYCTHATPESGTVIGLGEVDADDKLARKPVQSFALALAATAKSGIYAALVDQEDGEPQFLWFVAIEDGAIVPNTDTSKPLDEAVRAIGNLATLGFPVYTMGEIPGLYGSMFDPAEEIKGIVTPKLRVVQKGFSPRALLLSGAISAVVAMGAFVANDYYKEQRAYEEAGDSIQAQTEAYVSQVKGIGDSLVADSFWLRDELVSSYRVFPQEFAGWNLEQVECTPSGCAAIYIPSQTGFSVSELKNRYGQKNTTWDAQSKKMRVVKPGHEPWNMQVWTEDDILSPSVQPASNLEILGQLPTMYSGVSANESRLDLNLQFGAPGFAGKLFQETIETKADFYFDPLMAAGIVSYFAKNGFVATKFSVSRPSADLPGKWAVEWKRINGE